MAYGFLGSVAKLARRNGNGPASVPEGAGLGPLLRVLTDRGTEYCGAREHHEYQLYLAVEDIDHSRTKARHPQTNGVCERFHKTLQDEFYSTAFRKTLYTSLEQLQADLDLWLEDYNHSRPHSGKYCFGKTRKCCNYDRRDEGLR
jgi:transposase InsO family protein